MIARHTASRPDRGSPIISKRIKALVGGIAVFAAACGGTVGGEGSRSATAVPDPDRVGAEPSPPLGSDGGTVELFSPTEVDRPFDRSGGAMSSDVGVEVVTDDPLAGIGTTVAQAVAPWPTDWTRRSVGLDEFLLGIGVVDPRDRIPPIDTPKFEPIAAATWLEEREPGALVQIGDEVRFYSLSILTRHEIVNDRFGDTPVVVSYCPLCNTAVTFDARVDGEVLRFGVSGLLRNSDLVMWDDGTTSLWQQITGEAVVGDLAGTQLELIPTSIVSYADALESFPNARSLARDTGFDIVYGTNSYQQYTSSETPFLFDGELDDRYPALSRVVGVSLVGADKAYPFGLLSDSRAVNDELGGLPVAVLWGGDTADALDAATVAAGRAVGTGIAFDRRVGDQILTFSAIDEDRFTDTETDTDTETGSIWTLLGQAVEGPLSGSQLQTVQHRNEFWFAWASFFPGAAVYGE